MPRGVRNTPVVEDESPEQNVEIPPEKVVGDNKGEALVPGTIVPETIPVAPVEIRSSELEELRTEVDRLRGLLDHALAVIARHEEAINDISTVTMAKFTEETPDFDGATFPPRITVDEDEETPDFVNGVQRSMNRTSGDEVPWY